MSKCLFKNSGQSYKENRKLPIILNNVKFTKNELEVLVRCFLCNQNKNLRKIKKQVTQINEQPAFFIY